jgi:hypothetical protein
MHGVNTKVSGFTGSRRQKHAAATRSLEREPLSD